MNKAIKTNMGIYVHRKNVEFFFNLINNRTWVIISFNFELQTFDERLVRVKHFNKYKQQDELRREFVVLLDTACTEAY